MRKRNAFTLVELLVVIAIIGMLLALTLPAVMGSRESANATMCANNMRQLGLGIAMFANDHGGEFPRTFHVGADKSWVFTVAPYMENVDNVRICPNDKDGEIRIVNKGTSYVLNSLICYDTAGAILNRDWLRATSLTIVSMEGAETRDPTSLNYEHAHPEDWFGANKTIGWLTLLQQIQPDRHYSSGGGLRNTGLAHYLYADGHVEKIQAVAIKGFHDDGVNFALPQ